MSLAINNTGPFNVSEHDCCDPFDHLRQRMVANLLADIAVRNILCMIMHKGLITANHKGEGAPAARAGQRFISHRQALGLALDIASNVAHPCSPGQGAGTALKLDSAG